MSVNSPTLDCSRAYTSSCRTLTNLGFHHAPLSLRSTHPGPPEAAKSTLTSGPLSPQPHCPGLPPPQRLAASSTFAPLPTHLLTGYGTKKGIAETSAWASC